MRRSEATLLIAAVLLAALALWAGRFVAGAVEEAAAQRAVERLVEIGFNDVAVTSNGMVIEVAGRIGSEQDQARILAALQTTPGVSAVVDNLILIAPLVDLRPARLVAQKDEATLTLSGEAPNVEARDLLAAQARRAHPELRFVNLMKTQDRRAPAAWLTAAEAGLEALAALTVGEISVERAVVRIMGAAPDGARRLEIERRLADALGADVALTMAISAPPPLLAPYLFEAQKLGGVLTISACAAPTEAERSVILGAVQAAAAAGDSAVAGEPRCLIANGAPNEAWSTTISRGLSGLGALVEGELRVVDDVVSMIGFTEEGADLEALRARLAGGWPPSYALELEVREELPIVQPFVLTIEKRLGEARLAGYAPSRARAEAWSTRLDASNDLELARGAPADWAAAVDAVIAVMNDVAIGVATLSDRRFVVAAPGDAEARSALRARLRETLPPGYAIDVVAARTPRFPEEEDGAEAGVASLDPSIYSFKARRTRDGGVRLLGVLGDEGAESVVLAYARAQLGGEALEAAFEQGAEAAPIGWGRAIFAGLEALAGLSEGDLAVEPGAIYLRGVVDRGDLAGAAIAPLREKTPEEFAQFSQIRVSETPPVLEPEVDLSRLAPGACLAALNQLMAEQPILFEVGRAAIDLSQSGDDDPFDGLALILGRCPASRFEVGGHTDSQGDAAANMALSRQRAIAVRLSIIARGVDRERLISTGFGEESPIADNDTEEGRARNRRIEFRLLSGSAGAE